MPVPLAFREAANPVYEADRHAKKELKKQVRGYCAAVRSAITDDGRTPLAAPGLKLKARLDAVAASLDRVGSKGGFRRRLRGCAS